MFFKKIKQVSYQDIQRFANIYGFPYDDNLIDMFHGINGGIPVGFSFLYGNENTELVQDSIKRILSFNPEDSYSMEENVDAVDCTGNHIPFAMDEEENYICFCTENGEEKIKIFILDTEEFYDIYTEQGEIYTPNMFFSDLGC